MKNLRGGRRGKGVVLFREGKQRLDIFIRMYLSYLQWWNTKRACAFSTKSTGLDGVKEFGSKAIVSESYDPYCTVTLTRGLLGLIKATDEKEFKVVLYFAVNELICAGCVDSLVIEAVTDLANSASDNWDVTYLPRILHKMLFDWDSVNGTQ